jgi:aminopeptidase N
MHSYFYGIYGTDENLYHWMDEGLTQFAEARVSDIEGLNLRVKDKDLVWEFASDEPIATAANHFKGDLGYFYAAYFKGQLFAEILEYLIGKEAMRQGFGKYCRIWKFKHPEPDDFVKVMEDASGMELTWFQNYWLNTSKPIEIVIDSVWQSSEGLKVRLDNRGIPMPVEMEVTLKNQEIRRY